MVHAEGEQTQALGEEYILLKMVLKIIMFILGNMQRTKNLKEHLMNH